MPRRICEAGMSRIVALDPDGVTDPGEHVGDRVGHHGEEAFFNRRG